MDNKYYEVSYRLYTITGGQRELVEESTADEPFVFITGFGTTIPAFEQAIEALGEGEEFDFTVACADAYGERVEARVIELPKDIFTIDGKFDTDRVYPGAIVPLRNDDGNNFMGRIQQVGDTTVTVDLNHPLAGSDLNFQGRVNVCRTATIEECAALANHLASPSCGGCSGCGDKSGCNGCNGCNQED